MLKYALAIPLFQLGGYVVELLEPFQVSSNQVSVSGSSLCQAVSRCDCLAPRRVGEYSVPSVVYNRLIDYVTWRSRSTSTCILHGVAETTSAWCPRSKCSPVLTAVAVIPDDASCMCLGFPRIKWATDTDLQFESRVSCDGLSSTSCFEPWPSTF
jgi:hypothetical protein